MKSRRDFFTKQVLAKEIDTPKNDLEYVIYNNQYFNPDKTLSAKSGSSGIKLYDDIFKDLHANSVLHTRIQSVVGKEWSIIPAGKSLTDKDIAKFVEDTLLNSNFDFLRFHLLKSILYGFSCSEILWKIDSGKIIIDKFIDKHPIKFVFDDSRNLRLLTKDSMIDGIPVPDRKFILMQYGSIDNPYGVGLGQYLWWYVWFKNATIKNWLIFSEKFGQPTLLGSYPAGTKKSDRDEIQNVLNAVQTNSSIVLPEQVKISVLEARRAGNATYNEFCMFINKEISKCVLGQVLTTEHGKAGSYALGKIQNDVRQDIMESDCDLLDSALNQSLIPWIVELNFNTKSIPKIVTNSNPPRDLKEQSQIDKNIVDSGLSLSKYYYKRMYALTDEDIERAESEVNV